MTELSAVMENPEIKFSAKAQQMKPLNIDDKIPDTQKLQSQTDIRGWDKQISVVFTSEDSTTSL